MSFNVNYSLVQKQIATIKEYNPNVMVVNPQSAFVVPVVLPNNQQIGIQITLPKGFPEQPPVIKINPHYLKHPWIDANGNVVGHPKLGYGNWNSHALLGKIVSEIVNEFRRNPPSVGQPMVSGRTGYQDQYLDASRQNRSNSAQEQVYATPSPFDSRGMTQSNNGRRNSFNEPNSHIAIPPLPTSFPQIERLTREELDTILKDETYFNAFVQDLDYVKNLKTLEDELTRETDTLNEKTRELLEQRDRAKVTVNELNSKLSTLKSEVMSKMEEKQRLEVRYTREVLTERLRKSVQELENECEELAEKFIDEEVETKEFLKKFMEKRTKYHERNAKLIKYNEFGV